MSLLLLGAFTLFVIGGLVSKVRVVSYQLAAGGSLLALCAGLLALAGEPLAVLLPVGRSLVIGLRLDHLSATFLTIAATAWLAISLVGRRPGSSMPARIALSFNLTLAGMLLVFTAADMVSFLTGWEIMTVFAFLMLPGKGRDITAAFRFLAFGELSQALLVVGFAALFARGHSLLLSTRQLAPSAFLIAATLGAVVKMDVAPFHTWMREAYERLPGFVAALMSAGVTLVGVYALQRFVSVAGFLEWWMLCMVILGALSAFWGALHSTVTSTIRTIPAYSTVEYNGMILAVAAISAVAANGAGEQLAYLSTFAAAAVVVLALSHALAKSLFFLGLGETADLTTALRLEELRGSFSRFRRHPAVALLVAALSFAAFPPLVGYLGEWMVLETAFESYKLTTFADRLVASLGGVFVAIAIGLAAFAMVRFIGYFVSGKASSVAAASAESVHRSRTTDAVLVGLIALVILTAVGAPAVLAMFGYGGLFAGLLGVPNPLLLVSGTPTFGVLSPTMFAAVMMVLVAAPVLVWIVRHKNARTVAAWHGGAPIAARERFTPTAFSQILAHVMRGLLRRREATGGPAGSYVTRDLLESLHSRLQSFLERAGNFLGRSYMNGRIGWYVTYILVVFVLVLILAAL